jgi:phage FluMu gp28-like protein
MVSGVSEHLILLPYQRRWLNDRSAIKIWLAARQTGKSFSLALEAVAEALEGKSTNLILSASERQSREVMEKVLTHLRYFRAVSGAAITSEDTREEVRLPNGSRIITLPANPHTVRGFSGNVFLDEFAFHQDPEAIWRAMYPAVTRGSKARISSTPNGKGNLFHKLWTLGVRPSRHRTTIYDAVREGLPINIEELRAGILDADSWAQEYECVFLDSASSFIPYELIAECEDEGASVEFSLTPGPSPVGRGRSGAEGEGDSPPGRGAGVGGDFFLGLDIGRKNDLTVFWLWQKIGDIFWTRMVRELRDTPFSIQREFLYGLMSRALGPSVRRACIDSTGMGAQLAEEAREKFGTAVEPVNFTLSVKEDLAVTLKRHLEERKLRIPSSPLIKEDFHSIKRQTTSAGNVRFGAESLDLGHADRFWAAALGLHAAKTPAQVFEFEAVRPRIFRR